MTGFHIMLMAGSRQLPTECVIVLDPCTQMPNSYCALYKEPRCFTQGFGFHTTPGAKQLRVKALQHLGCRHLGPSLAPSLSVFQFPMHKMEAQY